MTTDKTVFDLSANNESPSTGKRVWNLQMLYESGCRILIVKATEGIGYTNPYFKPWCEEWNSYGGILGTYHYFWGNLNGVKQADNFAIQVEWLNDLTKGAMLPLWWDVERVETVTIASRRNQFKAMSEATKTYFPDLLQGIYTRKTSWEPVLGDWDYVKSGFWYWIAHWTLAKFGSIVAGFKVPWMPTGWPVEKLMLWQWCVDQKYDWCPQGAPGIDGEVDRSRLMMDLDTLKQIIGSPTTPPDPEPGPLNQIKMKMGVIEVLVDGSVYQANPIDLTLERVHDNDPNS